MSKENFYLSTGDGKRVKTEFCFMDVRKLKFYPENPRIGSFLVNIKKNVTDDEIETLMWQKQPEATKNLYQLIKKDGQVNEPLVVYKGQALEGNTRLCVIRKLHKETKDGKWAKVACRVVTEKLSKAQIDSILCNYHIKKKKDWEPYEQACYFHKMQKIDKMRLSDIAKLTDVSVAIIIDYVKTFEQMLKRKAEPKDWSLYYETIKNPVCKKAMKEKYPNLLDKVTKKYNEGKIGEAQDARKLKVILKDDSTAKKFFESDMDINTAERRALHRLPAESDSFLKDISELTESINDLPKEKVDDFKQDKRKLVIVKNFVKAIKKLCHQLKIRI